MKKIENKDLKKYLSKEEYEELKALEKDPDTKLGGKIKRDRYPLSEEAKERARVRAKLYRLRHYKKIAEEARGVI